MANFEKFNFLDEQGVKVLSRKLYDKVEGSIDNRFVLAIAFDSSTGNKVLSVEQLRSILGATTADGTGSTIFDRLKTVEGKATTNATNITTINGLLGESNAEAGTGTAFARIKKLEDDVSDEQNGLAALKTLITNKTHIIIETVEGAITTVANPAPDRIYLQKDDENDDTWALYLYVPEVVAEDEEPTPGYNPWVILGTTDIQLENYWSKDEINDLRTALGLPEVAALASATINSAVEAAFNNTWTETPSA